MLESVKLETKIYGYLQTSHFKLPNDPTWPVVMICAGSGIAPFRGFWMMMIGSNNVKRVKLLAQHCCTLDAEKRHPTW